MTVGRPDAQPTVPATPPPPVNDGMRRLQIGIAGVLTVLLLVGMAGLIGDRARENAAQQGAPTAEAQAPDGTQKSGNAPLEELGIQPVSANGAASAPAASPPPAADAPEPRRSATVPDLEPDPALERARQSTQ